MTTTTEEALLKARNTGNGPIFTEGQLLRLSEWCKQRGVDSSEFVPAYTDYVIAEFSVKSTGAEMAAHVELAVTQVPEPKVVLELYQKKLKRRPSGESPKEKLERRFRALEHEKTRALNAPSGLKASKKHFQLVLIKLGNCGSASLHFFFILLNRFYYPCVR